MKKYIIYLLLLTTVLYCCNSSQNPKTSKFSPGLIHSLYSELEQQFEIDFQESHLKKLLENVNINTLKNGTEQEQKFLFEDFDCACFDRMKISYSKEEERFKLSVNEELYEEGLDWCPESSYSYSFKIENNKIVDLKLDFMAG